MVGGGSVSAGFRFSVCVPETLHPSFLPLETAEATFAQHVLHQADAG